MKGATYLLFLFLLGMLLSTQSSPAQHEFARSGPRAGSSGFVYGPPFLQFGSPFFGSLGGAPYATAYLPKYWWVGPYAGEDPRQAGYNPDAGYAWDSVGTLLLTSVPGNARVALNGTFVGTTDKLGPFQLPVGVYTLRVEAAGYEPCETVVKFDQPAVQELNVELERLPVAPVAATEVESRSREPKIKKSNFSTFGPRPSPSQ